MSKMSAAVTRICRAPRENTACGSPGCPAQPKRRKCQVGWWPCCVPGTDLLTGVFLERSWPPLGLILDRISTAKSRQKPAQNKAHRRLPQNLKLEFALCKTTSITNKRIPRYGTCPKRGAAVSRRMASSIRSGPEGARGVFK